MCRAEPFSLVFRRYCPFLVASVFLVGFFWRWTTVLRPPRVINISVDLLLTTRYSLSLFYLLLLSIHLLAQANKHEQCRKHPPGLERARPVRPLPRCGKIYAEEQGGYTCRCQTQLPRVLRGQSRASSDVFVFSRRSTQHS